MVLNSLLSNVLSYYKMWIEIIHHIKFRRIFVIWRVIVSLRQFDSSIEVATKPQRECTLEKCLDGVKKAASVILAGMFK